VEKHPDAITGLFARCMTRRGQLVDGHPLTGKNVPAGGIGDQPPRLNTTFTVVSTSTGSPFNW
jgi:hypothetical protein